nr:MAG TPA: hypothetical protein [Caudoviricetes sp.]
MCKLYIASNIFASNKLLVKNILHAACGLSVCHLRFLGNPLHVQGVLFMMGVPTHTLYPCQQRGFFISAPIILFAAFPFPWLRQISSYGGAGSSNAPAFV